MSTDLWGHRPVGRSPALVLLPILVNMTLGLMALTCKHRGDKQAPLPVLSE